MKHMMTAWLVTAMIAVFLMAPVTAVAQVSGIVDDGGEVHGDYIEIDGADYDGSHAGTALDPHLLKLAGISREVIVTDIDDVSTEMNAEGGADGDLVMCREVVASGTPDLWTLYVHVTSTTNLQSLFAGTVFEDAITTESDETNGYWVATAGRYGYVSTLYTLSANSITVASPAGTVIGAGITIYDDTAIGTGNTWEFQVADLGGSNYRTIWDPTGTTSAQEGATWQYTGSGNIWEVRPSIALKRLSVADIDNPTSELGGQTGALGSGILCYEQQADPDVTLYTLYVMDDDTNFTVDSPHVVAGSETRDRWVALAGQYVHGDQVVKGFLTAEGATADIQAGDDLVALDDVYAQDSLSVTDDAIFGDQTEHRGTAYFESDTKMALPPIASNNGYGFVRWNIPTATAPARNTYVATASGTDNSGDRPYWWVQGLGQEGSDESVTFEYWFFAPLPSTLHGDDLEIGDLGITVEKIQPASGSCDVWVSEIGVQSLDGSTFTSVGSDGTTWLTGVGAAGPTELVATIDADLNAREGAWVNVIFEICDTIEELVLFDFKIYINGSEDAWIEHTTPGAITGV